MSTRSIGLLHPGAMGISLAASAQATGHKVYWVPAGRSEHTRSRAAQHDLLACKSLMELCSTCSIIISVCPPHAADSVAREVLECSFSGIFVDMNAIAPQKVSSIYADMKQAGIEFVDGGIIGGPAWEPQNTWLYLAGRQAEEVAGCFRQGLLETEVMGTEIGKASALKMSFAAYTKGSTALLCAIMAAAEEMGVREALEKQWARNGSEFADRTQNRLRRVTAKAWRFSGEMEEIATTLDLAGQPDGFHLAAADIYRRLADFKDAEAIPELQDVLRALRSS